MAAPHEVYNRLLGAEKAQSTVEFAAKHLRHYSPLVRTWAGRRLKDMNDAAAHAALLEAVNHPDARVRRAAFDAISGYDNWGRPFKRTIEKPGRWGKDGALAAVSSVCSLINRSKPYS